MTDEVKTDTEQQFGKTSSETKCQNKGYEPGDPETAIPRRDYPLA